jgi:hypothetical protein
MSMLFGVLVGSAAINVAVPAANAEPPDASHATVNYELTGSGVAGYVTYQTDSGQLHATDVTLPWSVRVTRFVTSSSYSAASLLSAQGHGPGSLTCVIRIDGKVATQNTATGDPARVVCASEEGKTTSTAPARPGLQEDAGG